MTRIKASQRGIAFRDFGIVGLSIIVAVVLARSDAMQEILHATADIKALASFLAGMFFTSVFTTAPATVALGELSFSYSPFLVAFWGALGALLGDFILFTFVRDHLTEDIKYVLGRSGWHRWGWVFRWPLVRRLMPFIGGLIIASPLPDELGMILLGFSKTKDQYVVPISLVFNFLGILAVTLVARLIA